LARDAAGLDPDPVALPWDLALVYASLLAREVPPLNPFYYVSVTLFVITFIPRLSFDMRRLHDSNWCGVWAVVPLLGMVAALVLLSALAGSMMNSSLTGSINRPDDPAHILYPVLLVLTAPALFWEEMFTIAKVFAATDIHTPANLMVEIFPQNGAVDIRRSNSDLSVGIVGNAAHTYVLALVSAGLVAAPVLAIAAHAMLNAMSSFAADSRYGPATMSALECKRVTDKRHNVFAGYRYLYQHTADEKSQTRNKDAAHVQALYRRWVLERQEG